jgi:hypothetical protein
MFVTYLQKKYAYKGTLVKKTCRKLNVDTYIFPVDAFCIQNRNTYKQIKLVCCHFLSCYFAMKE